MLGAQCRSAKSALVYCFELGKLTATERTLRRVGAFSRKMNGEVKQESVRASRGREV